MAKNMIDTEVDLHDIQGNILKGYGRFGFPYARYVMLGVTDSSAGRRFVKSLIDARDWDEPDEEGDSGQEPARHREEDDGAEADDDPIHYKLITTSAPWTWKGKVVEGTFKPKVTTNIAFTYEGLRRVGIPQATLSTFPGDFAMGMRPRASILGDEGVSDPENWDRVWTSKDHPQPVHILITINASKARHLKKRYKQIEELVAEANAGGTGVEILAGHCNATSEDAAYQEGRDLGRLGGRAGYEHFGFRDGLGDPHIKESGSYPTYVIGGGKRTRKSDPGTMAGWDDVATGEALLGHVDEADEYPDAPIPPDFAKNGTYLVYRKLHQNTASFNAYLESEGDKFGDRDLFAAKLVGRWKNGAPLAKFPTKQGADAHLAQMEKANRARFDRDNTEQERDIAADEYYKLRLQLTGFDYNADIKGEVCPVGSHIRRANPRGALEDGNTKAFQTPGALVNRRRIARRGLPYGSLREDNSGDEGDHGIIFMAIGASISRQFEFVQQQWMNYGNDFKLANDRDPIIGNQPPVKDDGTGGGRMTIEGSAKKSPHFCTGLPRFVETRGGDYFFVPSLTALSMIAAGEVDPT